MENSYKQQVALLLEILPIIRQYEFFALKGGTAYCPRVQLLRIDSVKLL